MAGHPNVRSRVPRSADLTIRVLVLAADATLTWIEEEFTNEAITMQVARSADHAVSALVEDPPPRATIFVCDFDALDPVQIMELHQIRERGWFGRDHRARRGSATAAHLARDHPRDAAAVREEHAAQRDRAGRNRRGHHPHAQVRRLNELETCSRATLLFDLATISSTMTAVATAAHAHDIRVLFAAKSFPHPAVLALAAEHLDGFDVCSNSELAAASKLISIADPTGRTGLHAPPGAIVSIETPAQLAQVPAHGAVAIRISASVTDRDPAIGAILDGSGHRRSRFGLTDRAAIAELAGLANGRRLGIHLHHGPVTATSAERFIASATAALALCDFEPAFLDLGGAWHGMADLPAAFAALRAAVPRAIELVIEPGRLFAQRAGFACGIVTAARSVGDRWLCVTDLSRTCHLRWSPIDLVAPPPHTGRGHKVLIVGPTCYEEDTIGEWIVDPEHVEHRVILRDVPGYALAWNTGFAGIPPAEVIVR